MKQIESRSRDGAGLVEASNMFPSNALHVISLRAPRDLLPQVARNLHRLQQPWRLWHLRARIRYHQQLVQPRTLRLLPPLLLPE